MTPLDFTRLRYVLGPVLQHQAALQQEGQVLDVLDALMPVIEAEVRALAPASLAAVQAVLDLHRALRIYDDCGHRHPGVSAEHGVTLVTDVGYVCEDGFEYEICWACCTDNEYQTEACAEHDRPCYPCPTVLAITTALIPSSPSAPTPGGGEAATACAPHMECAERGCYAEAVGLPEQCKRGAA